MEKRHEVRENLLQQTLDDLIEMTSDLPRNPRNPAKRDHVETMVHQFCPELKGNNSQTDHLLRLLARDDV